MKSIGAALSKIADRILNSAKKIDDYNKLFAENNYEKKIELIKERLLDEYKLWSMRPRYFERLRNVELDIETIKHLQNKKRFTDKEKQNIDRLSKKYNVA